MRIVRGVVVLLVAIAMQFVATASRAQGDDCSDFETQEEAQEFFEDHGGPEQDPFGLDPDEDGVACEHLPSEDDRDNDDDDNGDDDDDNGDDDDDNGDDDDDNGDDDDDNGDGDDDDDDDDRFVARGPRQPRQPRQPAQPRQPGERLPAREVVVSDDADRALPVTGQQIAMFGGSALTLIAAGVTLMAIGRRRPLEPVESSHASPPWGDDSLIGW